MQHEEDRDDPVAANLLATVEPSLQVDGSAYFSVDDVRRIVRLARRPFISAIESQHEAIVTRLGALKDRASGFSPGVHVVPIQHVQAIVGAALTTKVAALETAAEKIERLAADCQGHSAFLGSGFSDRELEEIGGVHAMVTAHGYALARLAQQLRGAAAAPGTAEHPVSRPAEPSTE